MRIPLVLLLFLLNFQSVAQVSADNDHRLNIAKALLLGQENPKEWVFESYDIDMSLANKCYSGGSFIFSDGGTVTVRNCEEKKMVDEKYSWKLELKEPHHVVLTIDAVEYFVSIYKHQSRKDALWLELTNVNEDTGRFSEFYKLIYIP